MVAGRERWPLREGCARDAHGFRAHADVADPIDGAEERCDESRAGVQINLFGRAHLLQAALVHDAQPVGERERFFLIVSDEQERDADAALDGFQLGADLLAKVGVERGERFVEQQNVGFQYQRSCQRDALAFAARKLRGPARFLARELHQIQNVANAIADMIAGAAAQAEFDVLAHRQMREKRVVLKHRADVALVRLQMLDAGAVEANFARGGLFESGHQAQRGGLAAARKDPAARRTRRARGSAKRR